MTDSAAPYDQQQDKALEESVKFFLDGIIEKVVTTEETTRRSIEIEEYRRYQKTREKNSDKVIHRFIKPLAPVVTVLSTPVRGDASKGRMAPGQNSTDLLPGSDRQEWSAWDRKLPTYEVTQK